jgi:hypothetical protein
MTDDYRQITVERNNFFLALRDLSHRPYFSKLISTEVGLPRRRNLTFDKDT